MIALFFSSVQLLIVSDSFWHHGLQHARLLFPAPTPGAYSNSCPLSWWCHPTISSCHPLLLLLSIFPSIRVFSNESVLLITRPKYWSFSFNISPSIEYSGLISFRIDRLDLLVVQGTLKSLLQHYSWKTSILPRSAFFTVQLSHPYMTTGQTITLTRRTIVDKITSLLFNMLSAAAAAAKSLQSCPTLWDPIDGSPPGSPIPGILQARTLEWVTISFSNAWKWKMKVKLLSHVQLLATPWTAAYQAPPSMGFSRQEYWSGVPLPSLEYAL